MNPGGKNKILRKQKVEAFLVPPFVNKYCQKIELLRPKDAIRFDVAGRNSPYLKKILNKRYF